VTIQGKETANGICAQKVGSKILNITLWDTLKGVDFQLKGGNRMKKLVSLVLVAMFALSMSACATMGKKEPVKVKCPACGYEFQAPMEGN